MKNICFPWLQLFIISLMWLYTNVIIVELNELISGMSVKNT